MRPFLYHILLFHLIFIALLSCNSEKKTNPHLHDDNLKDEAPLSGYQFSLSPSLDSAVYIQKSISKQVEPVAPKTEQSTQISISYPFLQSFKRSLVKDTINAIIQELLLLNTADEIAYNSLEERLESFIREYEMAKKEMEKELVLPSSWTCEVRIDVVLNTSRILALRFYEMNYTGGVHPNSFTRYFNFDMETGEMIALEDILVNDYRKPLLSIAEKCFKQTMDIASETPIAATAYEFPGGKFLLPRNFAITNTGLRFCFNPYDIGPYSMGTIEFEVPFDEILNILKQEALQ